MRHRAFTLIELLVTVAIIAVLAAIALPNFLNAQTRAKVVRVKADMATVATGLAAYQVDNNAYPNAVLIPRPVRLLPLTTPVAYLSTVPEDIFLPIGFPPSFLASRAFQYGAMGVDRSSRYALSSFGPDRSPDIDPIEFYPGYSLELFYGGVTGFDYTLYDPTNGAVSRGDIFRASDFSPSN